MKSRFTEEQKAFIKTRCAVGLFIVLIVALLYYFSSVWGFISKLFTIASPFFIGFALAFLLGPLQRKIEIPLRKFFFRTDKHIGIMRIISTFLSLAFLLLIAFVFLRILMPQMIDSLRQLFRTISSFIQTNKSRISEILLKLDFLKLDGDELVVAWDEIMSSQYKNMTVLLNNIVTISTGIVTSLYTLLVSLITAFYMLMDKDKICARVKKVCFAAMPRESTERLIYWTRRANRIFAGFITGKIVDSAIIGVICYICMLIFRMEYPLLISVIIGVTNVIPFFGPFIGWVPCTLILLIVNPMSALWFSLFILVLQQLDGNVIGPHILGDYVGVSALSIMIAIVIGSGLFGFTGMLLAVPVYALGYSIVRMLCETSLKKKDLSVKTDDYVHAPDTIVNYSEEEEKK